MRVTTQMTNQIAAETKIAVNQNSLLNSSQRSTGNTLLDELNKSGEEKASSVMGTDYEKTAKSADALEKAAELFMGVEDGSLLAGLDTEEGRKKAAAQLGTLAEKYNATLSALGKNGDELSLYYAQMMKELVKESKGALAEIGVSVNEAGKLSFQSGAFMKADADKIKSALGAESEFMQKLAFISSHIADNAKANTKSLISRYNAAGAEISKTAGASLFDSKG